MFTQEITESNINSSVYCSHNALCHMCQSWECTAVMSQSSESDHVSVCRSAPRCRPVSARSLCRSNPRCLPSLAGSHTHGYHGNTQRNTTLSDVPMLCIVSGWVNNRLPSSLLMNGWVLNGSKSSMCSPVPMKMMGLLVAATLTGNRRRRNNVNNTDRKQKKKQCQQNRPVDYGELIGRKKTALSDTQAPLITPLLSHSWNVIHQRWL